MIVKLHDSITKDPTFPYDRPFTEFEALIDLLTKGPGVLKSDPYEFSIRWMWDYEQAKNFIKSQAHRFSDPEMFITEEEGPKESERETAQKVVDLFNQVFNRKSQLNQNRQKMIMARIKEGRKMKPPICLDQFKAVFEFKKKQWTGTEQERFLRISTLCAPSHFLDYLEEAREDFKKSKGIKKDEASMLQRRLFS